MEFEICPGVSIPCVHNNDVSIERRMNVFVNQLLNEMLIDDKINQSKKVMALNFIHRKQVMLSKKANNGANIAYATQINFKQSVRKKLLLLIFKKTYSGPDEYQRRGKI